MGPRRRRHPREKDLTGRLLRGQVDEDRVEQRQRFSQRQAGAQQSKIERTALLRQTEGTSEGDISRLPVGQVVQAHGLFHDVDHEGVVRRCVVRKTLGKLRQTAIVTGDFVRFRETGPPDPAGLPEAVIEEVLPRRTVLTRSDSFKAVTQQPIVANAELMLIVASLRDPPLKWGLVDRMIVAALGGGLRPVICLNKVDLAGLNAAAGRALEAAQPILAHYATMGVVSLQTSVLRGDGVEAFRETLRATSTVLAGHSGVGKSSLIRAVQPQLDLRVGAVSGFSGKGRHTTASSRRYALDFGGWVFDTPGVRLFGLWGVNRGNLLDYFPDMRNGTAPPFRQESYQRITETLGE